MENKFRSHKNIIKLLINFGVWIFLAATFTSSFYFTAGFNPQNFPPDWWSKSWIGLFTLHLPFWLLWALITPFVFYLAGRISFDKKNIIRVIAFHLLISLIWILTFSALSVLITSWQFGTPWAELGNLARRLLDGRFIADYLMYFGILVVAYTFEFYRRSKEQESVTARLQLKNSQLEIQMSQTQLQNLKAQLQPHFLFNTLNSIAALIRKDEKIEATNMLASLSDLLRYSMEKDKSQFVTLQEEIEFIKRYLEIQEARFKERLQIVWQIEPEALNLSVPNMLLQPLVENAVRYGVAENLETGRLEIRARKENGALAIEIFNDGSTLSEDFRAGIGLTNTLERLEMLYGDKHKFELKNASPNGVVANLNLPQNGAVNR